MGGVCTDADVTSNHRSLPQLSGFVGCGHPEALVEALRARHDATSTPRRLHLVVVAAVGDGRGRGAGRLAPLLTDGALTYAWIGLCPELAKTIDAGALAACHNLPLGVVSHFFRDVAARRPGPVTRIGLGTFVDPRHGGGKRGPRTRKEVVSVVKLNGEEYLHYAPPPRIDVALLRGTAADADGNISLAREALLGDALNQAMAAHNSGGRVVVQVEKIVPTGSLPPRSVTIPGSLVDGVVVTACTSPLHAQVIGVPGWDGALCGERGGGGAASPPPPPPPLTGVRRVVAHRAMLAITAPHAVVNIGVGMPEGVAAMVADRGGRDIPHALPLTLTTEAGSFGGVPAGGRAFGASAHPTAQIPCASMLDLYNGGAIDVAVLGAAQVSPSGDVNVSRFPGRAPGCGGFIDISQSARSVVFVLTLTSGGLKARVTPDGRLAIEREGKHRKFVDAVDEVTFAAASAGGRRILYVTERAVFRLRTPAEGDGLELIEVAPGIDPQADVLSRMGFAPSVVAGGPRLMDGRCFEEVGEKRGER